jgi:hypothetical protein
MRGMATWLIATAIGAVVIAGVVDAVRRSSSHSDPTSVRLTATATTAQDTTEGVTTTDPLDTTTRVVESTPFLRLPLCTTRQLKLTIRVGRPRAEFVLRRTTGQPCHLRRSRVRLMVLYRARGEVPVSTSNFWWQRGT